MTEILYFFHNSCVNKHYASFYLKKNNALILPPGSAFEKSFKSFKIANITFFSLKQRIS